MKTLIAMTAEFVQLAELPVFTSFQLTRSFWGVGSFQLVLHPKSPGADQLAPDVLLFPAGESDKAVIVEDVTRTRDKLTVTGVQLKGLAKRRVCVPPLSLPARLWRYASGAWAEVTDAALIRAALNDETVLQGFVKPESPTNGQWFLDMTELGAVYDWGAELGVGGVVSDLGTAQTRSKYQNFGWDRFTGSAEDAYFHYAGNNLISPEDASRAFARLEAGSNQHRGDSLPWQARFDKLDALFASIGEATGLGWEIVPDLARGKFVFRCMVGTDRTSGSGAALLSEGMGNASLVTRKRQSSVGISTVYAGGAGEDENRMILAVGGDSAGLARREMWAEAGGVDDAALLRLYGQGKQTAAADTLTAGLLDSGACRYGVDYDLGDQVVVAGAGAQMNTRITSVTETYENGCRTLSAVFGDAPVTVSAVLSRAQTAAR